MQKPTLPHPWFARAPGSRAVLNRPVFVTSAAVTVTVTLWCVIAPTRLQHA